MADNQRHLSPWGEMMFTSLARPTKENEYIQTLKFNTRTQEGADFKGLIGNINAAKVITNKSDSQIAKELAADEYVVKFKSTFAPTVLDEEGNELEGPAIPYFDSRSDSGMARVEVVESHQGMKPTVYLKQVQIKDLELTPKEGGANNSLLKQAIMEDAQQA